MSDRTERSESHEEAPPAGGLDAPEEEPTSTTGPPRPYRPPNALGPFIPQGIE